MAESTHAHSERADRQHSDAARPEVSSSEQTVAVPGHARLVALQRTAGNHAVSELLRRNHSFVARAPAPAAAPATATPRADKQSGLIPGGGQDVNKLGVVSQDLEPELNLRSSPDTSTNDNVLTKLPFNTHVQVIKRFPGRWLFVSTQDGEMGYVFDEFINMNLPEPNARLHRVAAGLSGTAIAIAEDYFGQYSDDWGQDLRFYVNVLAFVNNISVPDSTSGWKQVRFVAGNFIWIPSHEFAMSLKGEVNSGSRTYNVAKALGIAGFLERLGQLKDDFFSAIAMSKGYLWEAISRHVEEALIEALTSLVTSLVAAIAILAILSLIGLALGGPAGAAIGFELGVVFLEWLGLALLITWIGQALAQTAAAFGRFFKMVWNARGDEKKLDLAAHQFAEALGILIHNALLGLIMFATSKGLNKASGLIRTSKIGKALGEARAMKWLKQRMDRVKAGRTKLPMPQRVFRRLVPGKVQVANLKNPKGHPLGDRIRSVSDSMERHGQEVYEGLLRREGSTPDAQKAIAAMDANADWSGGLFGRAFEAEMQLRIKAEHPELVYQKSVAVPDAGLPYRQNGRPDWRLPLGKGDEAVWDATMIGGSSQGKALTKYDGVRNKYIGEVLYPRPPHIGDVKPTIRVVPTPGSSSDE